MWRLVVLSFLPGPAILALSYAIVCAVEPDMSALGWRLAAWILLTLLGSSPVVPILIARRMARELPRPQAGLAFAMSLSILLSLAFAAFAFFPLLAQSKAGLA